jgi:hypothetical protein
MIEVLVSYMPEIITAILLSSVGTYLIYKDYNNGW